MPRTHSVVPQIVLALVLLAYGCVWRPGDAAAAPVRVAVAANLRDAFGEIVARFRDEHPAVAVQPVYTASGSAFQQIREGAPFDLFLSADARFPEVLEAEGRAAPGTRRVYARGRLALWLSERAPPDAQGIAALRDPRIRRVAVATPETAPYGRAAIEALAAAELEANVRPKLVFGQDVGQTAQIALAGADAAFLPLSYMRTPAFRARGRAIVIDPASHAPLNQAYLIVQGRDTPDARLLYHFLRSEAAREILERYGYEVP
jgi:molybdate transport system substrate-binding protein